jgi:hypothetical protein
MNIVTVKCKCQECRRVSQSQAADAVVWGAYYDYLDAYKRESFILCNTFLLCLETADSEALFSEFAA